MRSAGAAEAVRVVDGAVTFTVNVPLTGVPLLPAGIVIVRGEQVVPAGAPTAGHVTTTGNGLEKVPLGVTVIAALPLFPAVTCTAVVGPEIWNVPVLPPPSVPVKLKFKTLLPPKAIGFGSAGPNELTMM